jgi:ATP synthase protein I
MEGNPLGPHSERDWQSIGVASGLGCAIVVSLLLCIGGGVLLDRWLGITPIGVLSGVALGMFAAGYQLYELAVMGDPERGLVKLKKRAADEDRNAPKK